MQMNNRAYSLLEIKAFDDDKREITGIATTPTPDRVGDIVEPLGAKFAAELPLLWQHQHDKPVGTVKFDKPTKDGITFKASLPVITESGPLKELVDMAWQAVKAKLVKGVSIGFRPIEYSFLDGGGVRFSETEIYELSLVTIPAQAQATIQTIKSIDSAMRAASGTAQSDPAEKSAPPPGVSGTPKQPATGGFFYARKKGKEMNVAEQIKAFKDKRDEAQKSMEAIMSKAAGEGRTLDAQEAEEYDGNDSEIKAIDGHIKRLEAMEKTLIAHSTPVDGSSAAAAAASRAPAIVKTVKNEDPGIGFAKFALSIFAAKGDVSSAKAFAENCYANDTRLQSVMKAAVAAGTTTSPTWAGNLVDYQLLSGEFVEYLRPRTILGQLGQGGVPGLRRVPFNVKIPGKTVAGRAQWVGEGYRKPVTASGYETATLGFSKIAAISVVTDELARFSDPSILTLVRDDLAEAVIERMDVDFIDPAKAVGTGASTSPASITNGVAAIVSSGNDEEAVKADIASLWATADGTNMPGTSAVYITDSKTARKLAGMRNPLGQRSFVNVTPNGGDIDGVPLVVSNYVPAGVDGSLFILAFTSEIYLADDGVVNIAYSKEATIVMDDDATATPTIAQIVNMFQTNQEAIRAERYVHWKKRRPQAVAYLSKVNWGNPTTP